MESVLYIAEHSSKRLNYYRHTCLHFTHDDVIKWKHFPRYWSFVRGIHRSPVNSPHKGQWRGALMFSLICARINGWVNNGEAGDLRRNHAHYDVTVIGWYSSIRIPVVNKMYVTWSIIDYLWFLNPKTISPSLHVFVTTLEATLSACGLTTYFVVCNLQNLRIFFRTQVSGRCIVMIPVDSDGCLPWFGEMSLGFQSK